MTDKVTSNYRKGEIAKLKHSEDKGFKPSIKLFGSESGQTNQMAVSHEEFQKVTDLLTNIDGDNSKLEAQGKAIINLLGLKLDKDGRTNTSTGTKSAIGIAATVARIFSDPEFVNELQD